MKIIAGTDFSALADRAVETAFLMAERLGDSLEIVHVLEPPTVMVPELAVSGSALMTSLGEISQQRLAALAAPLSNRTVNVTWRTLSGVAEEVLPAYAGDQKARLLALGTHGRKGAARLFIGSVAERIVRRAHVPLLIVPQAADDASRDRLRGTRRPLRIVAGIEASPASDAALSWLRGLATATPCELSLVHVYWPLRELTRFGIEEIVDVHESKEEVAALLARELKPHIRERLGDVPAKLQLCPTLGRDADPLVHQAELLDADFLVVGTNQRRDRWGGSTAVAAVRAATRPVLCIPTIIEGMPRRDIRPRAMRTLLVPVDLTEASRAAVNVAFQMLRAGGGIIELLHVVRPTREGLGEARVAELERHLGELVPNREDHTILARPHFVESDALAPAILHAAERLTVDAVVMVAHRKHGLKHALTGSTVEHVFRESNKPVVIVPGEGA